MNPDAAKTIPAGYLGKQSHAETVRETYREQGRQEERLRIIHLLEPEVARHYDIGLGFTAAYIERTIELIKGEQK
jgi:hypothetical protein